MPLPFSRREILLGTSAAGLACALPFGAARAATRVSSADLRFLFVFASGGWDITQVFYNSAENPDIYTPEGNTLNTNHGPLSFVSHADRPSVDAFFDAYAAESLLVNGIWVPSIAHDTCKKYILTGSTAGTPDWGAIIAADQAESFTLPHIILAGEAFAGQLGSVQTRVGTSDVLDGLITGAINATTDAPTVLHGATVEDLLSVHLGGRAEAVASASRSAEHAALAERFQDGLGQAAELKILSQEGLSFETGGATLSQAAFALDALEIGLCRCATIRHVPPNSWDSHQDNDAEQTASFEDLFSTLIGIRESLAARPGTAGGTLADQTVIVVYSELARTPNLNNDQGKDHWPVTSAMLVGPGITGGRTVGGMNDLFYGQPIDYASGDNATRGGAEINAGNFGATLLELAGVDPSAWLPGYPSIPGLLG